MSLVRTIYWKPLDPAFLPWISPFGARLCRTKEAIIHPLTYDGVDLP